MFYLMVFLSLLVGVFIYAFDPVPMDSRHSLDIRSAEVFVVPFLNQHQAAKDYLKHWLGKVYHGGADHWVYNGSSFSSSFIPDAFVMAVPSLESFMQPLKPQQFFKSTKVTGLARQRGDDSDGYVSALVCLDNSRQLTRCYTYNCESSPDSESDNCAFNDIKRVRWHSNVDKKLLITYGVHAGVTHKDEKYTTGNPKALNQDLWRQAVVNRSHSSDSCGFLVRVLDPNHHWEYDKRFRDDRRVIEQDGAGDQYCIHNGHRCMSVVPHSIQGYLENVLAINSSNGETLDDVFFFMSETYDPYHQIVPPQYHYDGASPLNILALGERELNVWRPVDGDLTNIWNNLGTLQSMPFKQSDREFTLSFVTKNLKTGPAGNIFLLNKMVDGSNLFAIEQRDPSFRFYPNQSDHVDLDFTSSELENKMSWTIMRQSNGKISLFINGCQVQPCWAGGSVSPGSEADFVTFGGGLSSPPSTDGVQLVDVRYYNHALTVKQLQDNFKLDMVRYGIAPFDCPNRSNPNMRSLINIDILCP